MIVLEKVSVRAGEFALEQVSFSVPTGAYAVLMGPTGCGKTTLIEVICGLRKVSAGRVWVNGVDVTCEPPGNRGIGYVPQDGALFPTMTVREQLGFALRLRHREADEIHQRVTGLAAQLDITALLDRRPQGLSGGERQRVALGRALAARPVVLLLDEPLSALDEALQGELCDLLRQIQRDYCVSVLHVTHNRSEARTLADQLLIMDKGLIRLGDPAVL